MREAVTASTLVEAFNQEFVDLRTILVCGADEPLYLPAEGNRLAKIYFRADYLSSALHEVAHWCIAGRQRRQLVDYGYWYQDENRSLEQQLQFMKIEVKPQALEAIFSQVLGIAFNPSLDNFNDLLTGTEVAQFNQNIIHQCHRYQQEGLPPRARRWVNALTNI